MHMPKAIHPLAWIKFLGNEDFEDAHTCPWCGETFPIHYCEPAHFFREDAEHPERNDDSGVTRTESL